MNAEEQSQPGAAPKEIKHFGTYAEELRGQSREKYEEIKGYESLGRKLGEEYSHGLKPIDVESGEVIYGSLILERPMPLVARQPEYHAVLTTGCGIFVVNGLPEGGDLENYMEEIIPAVRKSFKKDVPDSVLEIPHRQAVSHPVNGKRCLTLVRIMPNAELSLQSLKQMLMEAEEKGLQLENTKAWAELKDPEKVMEALKTR